MTANIKTMQLYPQAERIYAELEALGYGGARPVPLDVLNQFDQLHYHGVEALDAAITATGMKAGDRVLEVGSGWGGCARYLAATSGAHVTAVELQDDYHSVGEDLTVRAGLEGQVTHVNADFLTLDVAQAGYAHVVSWLALFHIPERATYLGKIAQALPKGGMFYAEDLYALSAPAPADRADFQQHLFPNSLVDKQAYLSTLQDAGFEVVEMADMTQDWTDFTATRLAAFRAGRETYAHLHGSQGYDTIETFYTKMHGFFADGLVGGIRFAAKRLG